MDEIDEIRARVLPHYPGWEAATITRINSGLINRSFLLTRAGAAPLFRAVLQGVSKIFSPAIHDNIAAVTARLAEQGLVTPRLLPTSAGALYLDAGERGIWRLQSYVEGVAFDVVGSAAQARAAGELVGRFHRALDGFSYAFVSPRAGVHDTPAHLRRLNDAVAAHAGHRLAAAVRPLADAINAAAAALPPLPALAPRVCHGDLEVQQHPVRGAATARRHARRVPHRPGHVRTAVAGVRAGRRVASWCNRAGEDDVDARLDLDSFRASLEGYVAGLGRPLAADERGGLLLGRRMDQPGAGRPLRGGRARGVVFRLGPDALPGPRRAQPGARARPVVAAPGAGRQPQRARRPARIMKRAGAAAALVALAASLRPRAHHGSRHAPAARAPRATCSTGPRRTSYGRGRTTCARTRGCSSYSNARSR